MLSQHTEPREPVQVDALLNGTQPMEDVGVGDGSSNMAKKRRIVEVVDENLQLEHVKPFINNVSLVNKTGPQWSRVLCGSFTVEEQEPDFSYFNDRIRNLWKAHDIEIEYIMKKLKGFYIFIFNTDEGMLDALEKGPWTIDDVQIVLKRWGPGHFLDKHKEDKKNPVWIRMYDMPCGLWKLDVVKIMSSMFGIPIGVDVHTRHICEIGSHTAEYARVLVDVDTTRDLVDAISVSFPNSNGYLLSDLRIEYPISRCSFSKAFDHTDRNCVGAKDKANKLNEMHLKKEQQDTIIKVAVAHDQDLVEQIGKDIYFDLVDHNKVWSFCVEKQMPFNKVKEEVARAFGVPVECQRFWTWAKRQNHTYRPYRPLTRLEETKSVGELRVAYNKIGNAEAELNLFLETTVIGPDSRLLPPPHISKEDILVFFKLYDPDTLQLRYVGRLFVRSSETPTEIISKLNEMVGFSPDEEIELYEEIKFDKYQELEFGSCVMCERLDKRSSFRSSQIRDGDIICFQKLSQIEYKYADVPSFLEHVVRFRSLDRPNEDAFILELSKLHTYDDVADRVAKQLDAADTSKIRFTRHNYYFKKPESNPIQYRFQGHLPDMLRHYIQDYGIMYYEVLNTSLPELQHMKTLRVAFYDATTTKEELAIHNISLPKQSTVEDVLTEIKKTVKTDAELRLLQLRSNMIYKVLTPAATIEGIDDKYWTLLRAEKIPEEEKDMGTRDRRIHVYHFTREADQEVQNFGQPFFLVIRVNETLAAVKVRIQHKLQVPDEEFSKWKFAFVYLSNVKYLQDSDIVSHPFLRTRDNDLLLPPYLGLEHTRNTNRLQQLGCLN
ncbi:unnamed protein product [Lactuca saligna]|uniref:ubiquitinyl hydrolase 1 n=1 Tax=Lactuca saligna TaxID=75948 RepID=A0AA36DVT7_LACSI|nr:unnamed protein product [Lactuca saligna]